MKIRRERWTSIYATTCACGCEREIRKDDPYYAVRDGSGDFVMARWECVLKKSRERKV